MTAPTVTTDVEPAPTWLDALLPRRDARYLAVTALAAVAAMVALGTTLGANRHLPAYLAFGAWTAVIAAGDAVTKRIPNKLNVAALASGLTLLALCGLSRPSLFAHALLGAAIAVAGYFVLCLVAPGGL